MAVDFKTFLSTAPYILDCGLPVLIRGRHDDGRRATTWNAPDWLVQACTSPVVLFLDEVDRATLEVRQGLFELTDSRKINGWNLHPETIIIAAVNGGEHGAQYQVGEMDPAELDRWTVFDIEPNKAYPSRRSWKRFNDTGIRAGIFDEGASDVLIYQLANSFLGFEAASAFRDFARKYSFAVTVEQLLDEGDFSKVANWTINDQLAMVEKICASSRITTYLNDNAIANLVKFWHMCEGEVAMKFHTMITNLKTEENPDYGQQITIRIHPDIKDRFIKLVTGQE